MHLRERAIGLGQLLNVLEVDDVYGDEGIQVSPFLICGLLAETA
jgi:hypothetical protein